MELLKLETWNLRWPLLLRRKYSITQLLNYYNYNTEQFLIYSKFKRMLKQRNKNKVLKLQFLLCCLSYKFKWNLVWWLFLKCKCLYFTSIYFSFIVGEYIRQHLPCSSIRSSFVADSNTTSKTIPHREKYVKSTTHQWEQMTFHQCKKNSLCQFVISHMY